jgi:Predicted transcriptional regulator
MGKIIYTKLIKMMKDQNLTSYKIRQNKIVGQSTLQNIRDGKAINTDSIAALCEVLNCQPGDIMEYIPDVPNSADSDVE